jgi:hypothetical protein
VERKAKQISLRGQTPPKRKAKQKSLRGRSLVATSTREMTLTWTD